VILDLMLSSPEVLTPDEPLSHAARTMRDLDVGALPIVEDCPLRHAMTPRTSESELATVRPEDTADYVMDLMSRHQIRRVPVVSADERFVGIIALADVAREIGPRALADIVRVLEAISEPSKARVPAPTG